MEVKSSRRTIPKQPFRSARIAPKLHNFGTEKLQRKRSCDSLLQISAQNSFTVHKSQPIKKEEEKQEEIDTSTHQYKLFCCTKPTQLTNKKFLRKVVAGQKIISVMFLFNSALVASFLFKDEDFKGNEVGYESIGFFFLLNFCHLVLSFVCGINLRKLLSGKKKNPRILLKKIGCFLRMNLMLGLVFMLIIVGEAIIFAILAILIFQEKFFINKFGKGGMVNVAGLGMKLVYTLVLAFLAVLSTINLTNLKMTFDAFEALKLTRIELNGCKTSDARVNLDDSVLKSKFRQKKKIIN